MNVYKMNECDWWMATDIETASKDYLAFSGMDEDEIDPVLLTESELNELKYLPDNDPEQTVTFQQELTRRAICGHSSDIFATTEF